MGNPAFLVPALVISFIIVLATIFFSNKKTKLPLPPLVKDGMMKVIQQLQTPHTPQYVNRCSRELNATVFRLPLPEFNPFIVVASPTLARTILEGDKTKGIPESEKSHHYTDFQQLYDKAPSFAFSKTNTERWRQGRKGTAPAFSSSNIFRQFPSIIKGVNQFHDILSQHAADSKPVEDLTVWLNKLIFDILGSGMFQVEFNLLTGGTNSSICMLPTLFNPFALHNCHTLSLFYFSCLMLTTMYHRWRN
jgi:cytochrome P450